MDCHLHSTGYFYIEKQLYYLSYIPDPHEFLNRYHYYRYLMHQCGVQGYDIVKNIYQELLTQNYVLLLYHKEPLSIERYILIFNKSYNESLRTNTPCVTGLYFKCNTDSNKTN